MSYLRSNGQMIIDYILKMIKVIDQEKMFSTTRSDVESSDQWIASNSHALDEKKMNRNENSNLCCYN